MTNRVTIQDIADALNLSRNTVSKAINNTGTIADSTREMILKKAAEMGYKQFSYIDISSKKLLTDSSDNKHHEFAFLTTAKLDSSHFGATMIDKIQKELSVLNSSLTIYRVLPTEVKECTLPRVLDLSKISGIFCAELFNISYCRMLADLGIPVIFIDSPCLLGEIPLNADVLLMDNEAYAYSLIKRFAEKGYKKAGFVGDIYHCRSFYERYSAFRLALNYYGLDFDSRFSLIETEGDLYGETSCNYQSYIKNGIKDMSELPDLLICANDFIAIDVYRACRDYGIRIPDDIMVCGFDDSQESGIITPSLTTVHIHSQTMGHDAVEMMLSRIKQKGLDFRTVHIETDLIFRESTRF